MFYISRRSLNGKGKQKDWDIWYADRTKSGWSEPVNAGILINTPDIEIHPSVTNDGTLYFCRENYIYRSKYVNGNYLKPEKLGDSINSEYGEGDVFVARDESFIIFASGRTGGFGRNDLYISFRDNDGSWTQSKNMGDKINSKEIEYCPYVSPDGKYLFFTSYRRPERAFPKGPASYEDIIKMYNSPQNGFGDIYWVDAKVINHIKNTIFK